MSNLALILFYLQYNFKYIRKTLYSTSLRREVRITGQFQNKSCISSVNFQVENSKCGKKEERKDIICITTVRQAAPCGGSFQYHAFSLGTITRVLCDTKLCREAARRESEN